MIKQCLHEHIEYWQMKDGEEWWICMNAECSEKFNQPMDCTGGYIVLDTLFTLGLLIVIVYTLLIEVIR